MCTCALYETTSVEQEVGLQILGKTKIKRQNHKKNIPYRNENRLEDRQDRRKERRENIGNRIDTSQVDIPETATLFIIICVIGLLGYYVGEKMNDKNFDY